MSDIYIYIYIYILGEYALFGGSEGKWIEGIEQLPADFNNWELKLHNINYQMSQEDLLYVLQQYQVNCSFKSFGNGAAYIQCYDRDSFCRAMYLGGMVKRNNNNNNIYINIIYIGIRRASSKSIILSTKRLRNYDAKHKR